MVNRSVDWQRTASTSNVKQQAETLRYMKFRALGPLLNRPVGDKCTQRWKEAVSTGLEESGQARLLAGIEWVTHIGPLMVKPTTTAINA